MLKCLFQSHTAPPPTPLVMLLCDKYTNIIIQILVHSSPDRRCSSLAVRLRRVLLILTDLRFNVACLIRPETRPEAHYIIEAGAADACRATPGDGRDGVTLRDGRPRT